MQKNDLVNIDRPRLQRLVNRQIGFEPIVLAELIKLANRSRRVIQVSAKNLADTLYSSEFMFVVAIRKLQKQGYLEAMFDGDKLYFKLTGLCCGVA